MNEFIFSVDEKFVDIRIDKFVSEMLPELSRSRIQSLIDEENVLLNDTKVKSSRKLKIDEKVKVYVDDPKEMEIVPWDYPLDILYEDRDILVVNKPKGMPVHPSNGHLEDTLVNALMFSHKDSLSGINGVLRPGIVHRIDMDTTGSLIICKNDMAHKDIAAQIEKHSLNRVYEGIVHGKLPDEEGIINAPIGRDPRDRLKNAVVSTGKEAITRYKVIDRFREFTHVSFKLETGRTHQIRVHMKYIGFPILGDEIYGPKKCPYKLQGQTLHAKTIGFIHPTTKEYVEVVAPLPEYFKRLLKIIPR